MKKYAILLALILVAACKSSENSAPANPNSAPATSPSPAAVGNPPASTTNSAASVKSAMDVCSLLTSDDLRGVQRETYQQAQRSDRQEGDFVVAQCYYQMTTMANSVVLNFTIPKQEATRRH